ncbi:Copper-sensing transcriptional repressor CsoR [compost metagenome]
MSEKILQNLRRIEGQVKGLQRMIVEERECDEILTQIMAAKAALDRVTSDLVESQMERCFDRYPPEEIKSQMSKTIQLLCKR